jgi:transgelin
MAVSPGVKYKASSMPFVQMENISHFLRACEMAPINLPAHDRFLTVDLFDGKDPAQVLQCIAAFSRRANAVNPSNFPYALGGKSKGSSVSPQGTGGGTGPRSPGYTTNEAIRPRGISETGQPAPAYTFNPLNKAAYSTSGSGRTSPTKPPPSSLSRGGLATGGPVSSWKDKSDENNTAPAWNIHQYGYMGGASQGNLGVAFGARRQITSQAPEVPSLAEKEKRLREKLEQEQREAEDQQRRKQAEREAEEERRQQEEARARLEEERRWQEETRKLRQQEEDERKLQVEQRQRREREAAVHADREKERRRAEQEAAEERDREAQMAKDRSRQRTASDARLNGQFLSQYQAGQNRSAAPPLPQNLAEQASSERQRIVDLERQLEELRNQQSQAVASPPVPAQQSTPALPSRNQRQPQTSHQDDWNASERDYLRREWQNSQADPDNYNPPKPPRPQANDAPSSRPLPDPTAYTPNTNRTDRYLASNPAPPSQSISSHRPAEHLHSTSAEVDLENTRRIQSQQRTKAGGWASKSLLEREMERERERQREWEDKQKETVTASRDMQEGVNPGQTWDVHQYGYMGGDHQGRNPQLGLGGRRQIIGPRPPP